jgi:hypothetical protein
MKQIRNVSNELIIIGHLTLFPGEAVDVLNEDLLETDEVKHLLEERRIAILKKTG